MSSPFRDEFKIRSFTFGEGKPALAIVGAMRGDEIQQQYTCSQMVHLLTDMEAKGQLTPGNEILVIPNANHFSMNIDKRFWSMDNTDINRMFPGYHEGETTQRIAASLFDRIKDFEYGIQLASYYIPGDFISHIRMMKTGFQPEEDGRLFGLPYVYVKSPHPYDTAILNYNWQVWNVKAFSLYAGLQSAISSQITREACTAILRFMSNVGLSTLKPMPGYNSTIIHDNNMRTLRAENAGIFHKLKNAREEVLEGEVLAQILDPYDGHEINKVVAPCSGSVFFAHAKPLVLQNTLLYKIVEQPITF